MKILITNVYSHQNFGDAAIVESTISQIRREYPDAEISLMSDFFAENDGRYDCASVPSVFCLPTKASKVRKSLALVVALMYSATVALLAALRLRKLAASLLSRSRPYADSDVVLACGGGYLFSSNNSVLSVGLWQEVYHIWLGRVFGKPVVMLPQTVGPLAGAFDRWIVARALLAANLVLCRDKASMDLVSGLTRDRANSRFVPDVVYGWFSADEISSTEQAEIDTPRISITVLDWRWASPDQDRDKKVDAYLSAIVEACRELSAEQDIDFQVVPQVLVKGGDLPISEKLRDGIASFTDRVELLRPEDPLQTVRVYQASTVVLGSRMHSCIFAIASGTPAVGLSYQPKVKAMFDQFGLGDNCFEASSVTSDQILEAVRRVLADPARYRQQARDVVAEAQRPLNAFFKELADVVGR